MSTSFPFAPVRGRASTPLGLDDPVADQIAAAIVVGSLGTGERLPPEAEMAAGFGIAIATLRKSLGTLRDRGVVATRRGREGGTFVLSVPFPDAARVRAHLDALSIVDLRDYADEHATIAAGIAALACERATDHALDELRGRAISPRPSAAEAVEASQAGEADSASVVRLATADNRFQVALGTAAQSPRLLHAQTRLCAEISALKWSPVAAATTRVGAAGQHADVVAALTARDAAQARRSAAEQVRQTAYRVIDAKLAVGQRKDGHDR